jgi:uncharacterized protein (TIGR03492 family)
MACGPHRNADVKRLLVVSNGHGEDLEAAQILGALPSDGVALSAFPLVGLGSAYPPRATLLDPRRDFPSAGFGLRAGWKALCADLASGWLGFWRRQRHTLRAQRGRVDLVIAAGDVYCLAMAGVTGGPTVFIELPRSEHIAPHTPLEMWIIRCFACQVFTRDDVTADALRRGGLPAACLGFTLMDTLALSGEEFGLTDDRPVITLLAGSKPPAFENLILLLRASAAAAEQVPGLAVLVAWAPGLSPARLRETVAAAGGIWLDDSHFRFESVDAVVTRDHFADALQRATVVLGMAGAAHEQAAGLGRPVVAFPGAGPQFTHRFLQEQRRLLGDALVAASTWQEAAQAVVALLRDPIERQRRGRIGRERQGEPGASAAIARAVLDRLNA